MDPVGGRWTPRTKSDICCVSSDLHLWIAFVSSGTDVAQASLAKILFENVCLGLNSHMLFSCSASSLDSEVQPPYVKKLVFSSSAPVDLQAAVAVPTFDVQDLTTSKFDLIICTDEEARKDVENLHLSESSTAKVVSMLDYADVGQTCTIDSEMHVKDIIDTTNAQHLVMLRAICGLERFLVQCIPMSVIEKIHPALVPASLPVEMKQAMVGV